jgi:hypothetical protein
VNLSETAPRTQLSNDADKPCGSPPARMFVDRARAQQPRFAPEDQDPVLLADLVTRLEGIPLAIEQERTGTGGGPPAHHVTGQDRTGLDDRYALADWSCDTLGPAEQRAFAQPAMSVLPGNLR